MFNNPVYNLPSQFNENLLPQSLAALSLSSAPAHQDQHHQRHNLDFSSSPFQQQAPLDIGGYAPPSFNDVSAGNMQWPAPEEMNVSYQRGSTVVRQYNNSMIDDYYKKFLRPITDYVAIPTNGQPTYVYQNLGGPGATAGSTVGGADSVNLVHAASVVGSVPAPPADVVEEKKHKKKHKKRSSKHSHGDGNKNSDGERATDERSTTVPASQAEHPATSSAPVPVDSQAVASPRETLRDANGNFTGAVGPQVPMKVESNPVVYFDIEIDDEFRGRLVMELFHHVLPRTSQNFLSLTLNEHGFGYRYSYFHRIIPGFMAQAGDFEKSNGTGGYSIYGEKFDDEGFPYPHDRAGLLSMANSGPHTNGSQFFVTFAPCPHLDNKHVVYGQVLQGFHLLKDLEMSGSESGEVLREVKIAASEQLQ